MVLYLRNFVRRLVTGYKTILERARAEAFPGVPPIPVKPVAPMPVELVEEEFKIEGFEIPKFMPSKVRIEEMRPEEKVPISLSYPLIPRKPAKGEPVFAYANISWDPKAHKYIYQVIEPELSEKLKDILSKVRELLEQKLDIDFSKLRKFEAVEFLHKSVDDILTYFKIRITEDEKKILHYYVERDFIGLGRIEPFMRDPDIEDISCDGLGIPIFIFHRNPEIASVITNVVYDRVDELDSFILRLAQLCGKSISVAEPLVGGSLPDGSRLQAALATDIARRGSNFTIRKFTERPLTPVHLLNYNTLDVQILAYLWLLVDYGKSTLVSGGTASGKTTLLNVLSLFIRPEKKICSIEDSVTGDCEIVICRDGRFERTKIGELVDSQIDRYGSEIYFDREVCRLNPDMVSVFALDSNGKIKLVPVSLFVRHKVKKDIFEIVTRTGRKIKVTGDHSLFCLNENADITPTEVRKLSIGSFIAVPRYLPFSSLGIKFINLLSLVKKLNGLYVCGEPIKDIPKELLIDVNVTDSTKRKWLKLGMIPTEILWSLFKKGYRFPPSAIDKLYLRPCRKGYKLPVKLELDKDFLSFIGLWLAEGSYDKNSVIISNEDEECREIIKKVSKKFDIPAKFHSDGTSLMLNSCVLKRVMEVLGLKGNAYTKRIPDWMFNLSNEQLAYVLLGDFSGDGSVSKYEIERNSSSLNLLKDIQAVLLRFGIISRISKFRKKDNTYQLRISSIEMLRRFREKINFLQSSKSNRLSLICEKTSTHDISDIIPFPKSFLKELEKTVGRFGTIYYYGSNIGRRYLAKISTRVKKGVAIKASILANSDVFWDEIAEVVQLPYIDQYVYDLSVPELENFICEGIVAHNTPELKLPHSHWVPHVARVPMAVEGRRRIGEVDLFDLLKESLRYRPDYIVVGEVRGKEAFVLFQEMATGHPSLATIHAENLPKLVDRLTTPPIELPATLIGSLDLILFLLLVRQKEKHVRRISEALEVVGVDPKTKTPITNRVFKWNPVWDKFEIVGKSALLKKISESTGLTEQQLKDELERRMLVLNWMKERNIVDYEDVFKTLHMYYAHPERVLSAIKGEVL